MVREIADGERNALLLLYSQLHDNPVPAESEALEELWGRIMQDENHHIVVAESDGSIVSSCVLVVVPNLTHGQRPYALVENVVTDRAHRGRGYATKCLAFAAGLAHKATGVEPTSPVGGPFWLFSPCCSRFASAKRRPPCRK